MNRISMTICRHALLLRQSINLQVFKIVGKKKTEEPKKFPKY